MPAYGGQVLMPNECKDLGVAMYRAAYFRDIGMPIEQYKKEVERIRDEIGMRDEKDAYVFKVVMNGVIFVYATPDISPNEHARMFYNLCVKNKGEMDTGL